MLETTLARCAPNRFSAEKWQFKPHALRGFNSQNDPQKEKADAKQQPKHQPSDRPSEAGEQGAEQDQGQRDDANDDALEGMEADKNTVAIGLQVEKNYRGERSQISCRRSRALAPIGSYLWGNILNGIGAM